MIDGELVSGLIMTSGIIFLYFWDKKQEKKELLAKIRAERAIAKEKEFAAYDRMQKLKMYGDETVQAMKENRKTPVRKAAGLFSDDKAQEIIR